MGSIKRSVGLAVAATLISGQAWAQQLRIYHIDVDQGDSTLFVAPAGNTLLVDSGRNGHGSRIQNVMATAGVIDIDFYVTTHYHADHYGGIDEFVDAGVTVLEAYDRGDKQFLRNILRFAGIGPIRESLFGMVENVEEGECTQWLDEMRALGAQAR